MSSPHLEQTSENQPRRPRRKLTDPELYFLAVFIPPFAVYFKCKFSAEFWLNVALTILGWILGVFHAW
ncbi:hypothetical protein BJY52DRAFT_1184897 [Lactarius psammicola]|nr:hypothetical protein BJY52DRAFT_1184897 [Lactarius psammicola]